MNNDLQSTLMHTLEFVVIVTVSFFILRYFDPNPDAKAFLLGTVLTFLTKYARVDDKIPFPDYVNPKKD